MFETKLNFALIASDIIGIIIFIIYYLCKLRPNNGSSIELFRVSSLLQFSLNTFIFIFLISHFNNYLPLS